MLSRPTLDAEPNWAAWQAARVEVKQEAEAKKRDRETSVEHKIVEPVTQET